MKRRSVMVWQVITGGNYSLNSFLPAFYRSTKSGCAKKASRDANKSVNSITRAFRPPAIAELPGV